MRPTNEIDESEKISFIEAARRAQIIESAIETIASLGYANASLAQIAKHARISKGVISYHFAGKEELLQQVVTQVFTTGALYMQPKIEAQTTATTMLRAYIESNIAFMAAYPRYIRAVVEIIPNFRNKQGALVYTVEDAQPILEPLEGLLRWGQESGEFRDFSTRVMALAIRGAIDAVPGQMTLYANLDIEQYGRELVLLFDQATRKLSVNL